ncbi:hypothetical protein M0M57_01605 [Flavobacterium azooxidireducens]|uniref:Uncharacterized protein n=1 Tax=Flavobacterium azooxidireducens TaxID=1871076 RepID=A0ABY4KFH0_9FLAO|nr:hypothetical protein [Flavobacterium azooxidireducens]UPQ79546.1 hypothetical protein M0M57_01605 [Flavobacterium azooxidireducens]
MDKFKLELFFQILGIGATSGLVFENDSLFLISDSSSFLYEYNFKTEKLDKIELFENSLESITKKDKPDFESITKIGDSILLLGSGSTEKRMISSSYHTKTKKSITTDLTKLFEKISESTRVDKENLNVEGVLKFENKWFLFQRGNGLASQNGIFVLSDSLENPSKIDFIPIILPKEKGVHATFTDAVLVEDQIYFLAAAEDSNSTYEDGVVLGSWIGTLHPSTFELLSIEKITNSNKFEGLTVYKNSKNEITFLLCEDNDSEILKADIYKLTIKKTTH